MLSKEQQAVILEVLAPFEPIKVGVFGSHARNEAGKDSDMDILVQFQKKYSLFDLIEIEEKLSRLLHSKVDIITERSLHPGVKPYIEKDLQLIS